MDTHRAVAAAVLNGMVQVIAPGRQHGSPRRHHAIRLVFDHQKTALVVQLQLWAHKPEIFEAENP